MKSLLTLSLLCICCLGNAAPKSSGFSFFKEGERKVRDRWTIASWWDTKQKVRTMNYWLARNSKNKSIEFSLQSSMGSYQVKSTTAESLNFQTWSARTQAFASLFGLEANYSSSKEQMSAMEAKFWIRLFGIQVQDSQFLIGGGYRKSEWKKSVALGPSAGTGGESLSTSFLAARLELFLIQNLGVNGEFSLSQEAASNQRNRFSETQWSASAFLDFSAFRVFGLYRNSLLAIKSGTSGIQSTRDGYSVGFEIFF